MIRSLGPAAAKTARSLMGSKPIKLFASALLLAALIACCACSSNGGQESAPQTPGADTALSTPVSQADAALAAYRAVIAKADTYDYGADPELAVTGYRYALETMQSGDAAPTLLLAQATAFGIEYVRVFRFDPQTGTAAEALLPEGQGPIMQGAGSAGGFRGTLGVLKDGSGLCMSVVYSGTGDCSISRIAAEGGGLTLTELWSGSIEDDAPVAFNEIVSWYDTADSDGAAK